LSSGTGVVESGKSKAVRENGHGGEQKDGQTGGLLVLPVIFPYWREGGGGVW
jgi:hypothetical protein